MIDNSIFCTTVLFVGICFLTNVALYPTITLLPSDVPFNMDDFSPIQTSFPQNLHLQLYSKSIMRYFLSNSKDTSKKKKRRKARRRNAVPPSADGANAPVTKVLRAGPVSLLRHPIAVPAAGIYHPGQHHKPVRFHVACASAGLSCYWNSA